MIKLKFKRIIKNGLRFIIEKKAIKVIYDILLVVLIPGITIVYNYLSHEITIINNMNSITIGSSVEYMDNALGIPICKCIHDDFEERVYNNTYGVVRAFYEDGRLIGYCVTAKKVNSKLELPRRYKQFSEGKNLGKFTFSEIKGTPGNVDSYITNGSGDLAYCEEYYFGSSGDYNIFEFIYIDYGFEKLSFTTRDEYVKDEKIEKAVIPEYEGGYVWIDRKESYPNSYAIMTEDVKEYILSYIDFQFGNLQ